MTAPIVENYPGPWQARLFYTTDFTGQHQLNFHLDVVGSPSPGAAFSSIDVVTKNASSRTLASFCDDIHDKIKPLLTATSTIDYWELWKFEDQSNESSYWSTYNVAEAGSGSGSPNTGYYNKYSFRTLEGGIAYVTLFETIVVSNLQLAYADMTAAEKSLVDEIIQIDTPVLGIDTSFVWSFKRSSNGQNERLFNKAFRD